MVGYKPNIVLSNVEFDVVGTRPVRHCLLYTSGADDE